MIKNPLEMDVYMDSVDVEKQSIPRPDRVTRSILMRFWEAVAHGRCPWCDKSLWYE